MKRIIYGLFISAILIYTSCNESDINNMNMMDEGTATIQFKLIDNPVAYDAVLIDVQGLEYKMDNDSLNDDEMEDKDDDDNDEMDDDDDDEMDDDDDDDDETESTSRVANDIHDDHDEEGEWVKVDIEPRVYDLLQLNNGAEALLAEADVKAGDLKAVRVILGDNNKVVIDGDTLDLFVPSGSKSGLKIKFHEKVDPGEGYELIIDFDASKSIVHTGNDKYILKPVIKVTLVNDKNDFGSISGVVTPLDLSSVVYAINMDEDSASAIPEEDGTFLIKLLEEGAYSVVAVPDTASEFSSITMENIEVMEGVITELDSIKFE